MSDKAAQDADTVCAVGGRDDGSLRLCCSSHGKWLCGKHYALTHFVEVGTDWERVPCNAQNDGTGCDV